MMRTGMSYENAHEAALIYYNAKEFNLYHPEVIKNTQNHLVIYGLNSGV